MSTSPKQDIMLVPVPSDYFCQVVHKLVVVLRPEVVQPGEHIPAGAPRDRHPVGRGVGEGLEDASTPLLGRQQHPALICIHGPVPLPVWAPEAARGPFGVNKTKVKSQDACRSIGQY